MHCPKCGSTHVRGRGRVHKIDPVLGQVVRRTLSCDNCRHRFKTTELMSDMLDVLATDHWGMLQDLKRRMLEGIATINSIETRRAMARSATALGDTPDGG